MARSRLPGNIRLSESERERLLKLGACLGTSLKHIISIVTYRTFLSWRKRKKTTIQPEQVGRPRTMEEIEALILRIARETGWGYTRIIGELRKLKVRKISRTTVKNILLRNSLDPGPARGIGTWDEFIKIHRTTLWACDFLVKRAWTRSGLVDLFVFFVIHIESRKVYVSGVTSSPNDFWMAQQARNLCMYFDDAGAKPDILIKDGDKKITRHFDGILMSHGMRIKKIPYASPNLNAFAERWVQSIKNECLDHFVVFGENHLWHIVAEYADYYNTVRPHQGVGNVPLGMAAPEEESAVPSRVKCKTWLGGVLRHYYRAAG
ncbi:MAG: integrase core domain-containing protein [Planctomycetota bacterium]